MKQEELKVAVAENLRVALEQVNLGQYEARIRRNGTV